MRLDTEQCKTGCVEHRIKKANVCPWSDSNEEAENECCGYRNAEAIYYPKKRFVESNQL